MGCYEGGVQFLMREKKVSVNEGAQDVNQVKIMSSDFSDKHFKKVALP